MCGIAGIHLKDYVVGKGRVPTERLVDGLLLGIESRGGDATGYVATNTDGTTVQLEKDPYTASSFIVARRRLPQDLKTILLHTRLATQGTHLNNDNNHPVQYHSCFTTHNGVIMNDFTLFNEKEFTRVAAVDSIIIPTMVVEMGWDKVGEALGEIRGSMAVAIIDPKNHPNELILAKGDGSPLVYIDHPLFFMWASTSMALQDAWKYAWGTPPDTKKFHYLRDGEMFHFQGDAVTQSKWEPARYQYQSHSDYYGGWGWNNRERTPTHTERSSIWCFECGDKVGNVTLQDGYKDEQRDMVWDYPVCAECFRTMGGAKATQEELRTAMTYRYCNAVKTRDRTTAVESKCHDCAFFISTHTNSKGFRVCEGCFQHDKRNGNILELTPGDPIPTEMQGAWNGCEACGENEVSHISEEGFVICADCRMGEIAALALSGPNPVEVKMEECESCNELVPKKMLNFTIWGQLCNGCADGNTASDEFECDNCGEDTSRSSRVIIGDNEVCEACYQQTDEFKNDDTAILVGEVVDEDEGEPSPLDDYEKRADFVLRIHKRTCIETAWEMNTTPALVEYLLHESAAGKTDDQLLIKLRDEAKEKYEDNRWIIEHLVSSGRDDLVDRVPLTEHAVAEAIGVEVMKA